MSILNIRPAVREGARLVIGIAGVSGSGKTFTALQMAWGMAKGDASKVGLLDTENKRGSLYSDILVDKNQKANQFMIGDLYPPFSPQRYSEAIKEFQASGVEVLVVDSGSHEWEGEGGCEDIADDGGKVANWKKAKREHKRFMNTLLTCDMHIILCLRAREKTSFKNPAKPESLGIQPICEKNVLFEMTASMLIHDQGSFREILKCPADLQGILGKQDGYLGAREGLALRQWVDGGAKLDPEVERARNTILSHTAEGLAKVEELWSALAAKTKKSLGQQFIDMARSSAQEFDAQAAARNAGDPDDLDMSSGGFNPMTAAEPDMVAAHKVEEAPPQYDDDPFSESA
ncbi:hypothetical protein D3C85_566300 [compost metagenome]